MRERGALESRPSKRLVLGVWRGESSPAMVGGVVQGSRTGGSEFCSVTGEVRCPNGHCWEGIFGPT